MFVAKRKLAGIFSILTVFVVVMTINHYFYLEPTRAKMAKARPALEAFRPGEEALKDRDQPVSRPMEMSVQEEIRRSLQAKHVQFVQQPWEDKTTLKNEVVFKDLVGNDMDMPDLNKDGTRYIPRRRVVHLDLKGAPPKLTYLQEILPLLRSAGATTILMEYEDMFPFSGILRNVSAKNCFRRKEVKKLLRLADEAGLEVIPLVQTFGHMELVLKLEEFRELREESYYPQALCPSQDKSWNIIKEIIDQVLKLHPKSRWLHVGCDEVFQLGSCSRCQKRISQANSDPKNKGFYDSKALFLDHVHRVGTYVREQSRIPIIWDDMLRTIPGDTLTSSGIGAVVEPMVWVYVEDVDRFVDPITWNNYGIVFQHVWTASAFKGAFGERLYTTNMGRHVGNSLSWLEVMRRESQKEINPINFRGLVLTGWSRYDHFAVLCELLPTSLPSLILNLAVIRDGAHSNRAAKVAHKLLDCSSSKPLMTPDELMHNTEQWDSSRSCKFPGVDLMAVLSSYDMTKREVESIYDKITKDDGWMSDYNVHHRFSSASRVHEAMRSVTYLPSALQHLRAQFKDVMSVIFDKYTVAEWLEQHLLPLDKLVSELNRRYQWLTDRSVWPRRPLEAQDQDDSQEVKVVTMVEGSN